MRRAIAVGLEVAHAERPEVILMDIRRSGMDGYSIAEQLR